MTAHLLPGLPHVGQIIAWGEDVYRQVTDAPTGTDFTDVAPGGALQSLAIRKDGSLELWGGVGAPSPVIRPLLPPLVGDFVDASISVTHFVAIRRDHTLVPHGDFVGKIPVASPPGLQVRAAAGNASSDVAIAMDRSLTQWGAIGPSPAGKFTKVSARGDYAIALRNDGRLFGWGSGLFATLSGWTADGAGHFYIDGPFIDLAAGILQKTAIPNIPHFLALKADGTVQGWGANTFGETNAPPGVFFSAIAAGTAYSLGLDSSGYIHHWGDPGASSATPKGRFIAISAAGRHAAAVRVSPS